jgi:two-component system cell cycle response regulator
MATSTTSHDANLLLVDDDPSAIHVMSRMLAHYPNQRFAMSGEVALRLAHESTPDLIVLDAEMSGMSGFAVFAALQADAQLTHVPVIFATSHRSTVIELTVLQQGAVDFVTKPLDTDQFVARVQAHLRNRSLALTRQARRSPYDASRAAALGSTQGLASGPTPGSAPAAVPGSTAAPLPASAPGLGRPLPPAGTHLLIVDDNVAAIQMLSHTLGGLGECHFATTGAEALRLVDELQPQIILLDAHLPDLDGFDICAALREQSRFDAVPIVFITRFSDLANEKRALDLGASDFIAKPYTPAVLLARVSNLLALTQRADVAVSAGMGARERAGLAPLSRPPG